MFTRGTRFRPTAIFLVYGINFPTLRYEALQDYGGCASLKAELSFAGFIDEAGKL